jgi:hypothetical protein
VSAGARFAPLCLPLALGACHHDPPSASRSTTRHPNIRQIYVGVACPVANSIRCDQLGVAVWIRGPARRVMARLSGRRVTLRRLGRWSRHVVVWDGRVRHAGIARGPDRIVPRGGGFYWVGNPPHHVIVCVAVLRGRGAVERTRRRVAVQAGYG